VPPVSESPRRVSTEGTPGDRSRLIVDVLVDAFSELMTADADAFRTEFRTMAADPFAFYRGSACLFYADMDSLEDRWADERTSRVWIQGVSASPTQCSFAVARPSWTITGAISSGSVRSSDHALVGFQTEDAIVAMVGDRREEFCDDMVAFAHAYARRAQEDHRLFVDAFRAGAIPGISSSGSHPVHR
jgi:uncharacterized protein (DUF2252 family)